jgi:tetratricopeptide (TPR) repeat protein
MTDSRRIEDLKRRVQQDPASIAFAALADEYRRAGQYHDAIETCRAGLQRHPAYLSARVTLGRALLEIGEYDEAQTHLEQVLRSAPENLAAIRALAEIHERRGDASFSALAAPPAPAAAPQPPRVIPMPIPRAPEPGPAQEAAPPVVPPTPPAIEPPPVAVAPSSVREAPRVVADAVKVVVPSPVVAQPAPEPPPPVISLKQPAAARPEPDPAAQRLEAFLAAIQRARVAAPRPDRAGR